MNNLDLRFKKACNDCPFRRKSLPGWLGAHGPEWFISNSLADESDYPAPCHQTIDYTDPYWETTQYPEAAACAGSVIFCANMGKMPRNAERAAQVREVEQDFETIFARPEEFMKHHSHK